MSIDLSRLADPFHSSKIHWRVGSTTADKSKGMALAYLDARDVMDRLDAVCGPSNWQSTHNWSDGSKVQCSIGIKAPTSFYTSVGEKLDAVEWVWKSDGAGDTAYEGDKGAFSDALKRAAVNWGIGRYLYSSPNWWQPIVQKGKSYVFTDAAQKDLNKSMDGWLLPGRQERFNKAYGDHRTCFDSFIDALIAEDLKAASEYWNQIPRGAQEYLWLAKSSGGILDQKMKAIVQSTKFAVAEK